MKRLAHVVLLAVHAGALAGPAQSASLRSSAALARELAASRRARATLRYEAPALPGAVVRTRSGTLTLEAPDRVRLDLTGTAERLVARGDGGEWLQPATRQLLRFGPRQVSPALRWWRVLLGDTAGVRERRSGPNRYVLALAGPGVGIADSATVWLDARGLPERLRVHDGDDGTIYRLSDWRFARAEGLEAFRLEAPAGYETVDIR